MPRKAPEQAFAEDGHPICGAKTRSGGRCMSRPVTGSIRCRMHGGKAPSGIASPSFRHGRYSTRLPVRLREAYLAARDDADLLGLTDEIALVESRLGDLLGVVESGESGEAWAALGAAWIRMKRHRMAGNVSGMTEALDEVEAIIGRGMADRAAWAEIRDLVGERRKLSEAEGRRRVQMQSMITIERLDLLVAHFVKAVQDEVSDPAALRRISEQLSLVLGPGPGALR